MSYNTIPEVIEIHDADGNDVTKNYTVYERKEGELKVVRRKIIITSSSKDKEYDRTPLTSASIYADKLLDGHVVVTAATGSQTEIGKIKRLSRFISFMNSS